MCSCPGEDIKRYPSGLRLDNRKVFCSRGPGTKHFKRFYFCRLINNINSCSFFN